MVKVYASEEMLKVAQNAMELHGGNGVMLDFGVERIFRDAAMFLHREATADISRFKIVKARSTRTRQASMQARNEELRTPKGGDCGSGRGGRRRPQTIRPTAVDPHRNIIIPS